MHVLFSSTQPVTSVARRMFVVSAPATRLLCGSGAETQLLLLLLAVGGSLVPYLPCHQTLAHHGSSGAQFVLCTTAHWHLLLIVICHWVLLQLHYDKNIIMVTAFYCKKKKVDHLKKNRLIIL